MSRAVVARSIHGSCVALGTNAVLITGAAGVGKSTLALEMIALGCRLVADDTTCLRHRDGALIASAPENTAGLVEARELGIIRVEFQSDAVLRYIVDLDCAAEQRLPALRHREILGVEVELICGQGIYGLASKLTVLLRGGRVATG